MKKHIAREGLIFLGFLGSSLLLFALGGTLVWFSHSYHPTRTTLTREQFNKLDEAGFSPEEIVQFEKRRASEQKPSIGIHMVERIGWVVVFVGGLISLLGYPGYWLVKFIRWAVRTLKAE